MIRAGQNFLIMDMGGTNVRLSVVEKGRLTALKKYKVADFKDFYSLLDDYQKKIKVFPDTFLMALPTPFKGDKVHLINNPWLFRVSALKKRYGFKNIQSLNDFEAVSMALPYLKKKDVIQIGKGKAFSGEPKLVLGAGTGLGVGIWTPERVLSSEGGHLTVSFLPDEKRLQDFLSKKYSEHISAERLISAQGLENLYSYLSKGKSLSSFAILDRAEEGDKTAEQSILLLLQFLGRVAGDLALVVKPLGGVYLCGGVLQHPATLRLLKDSKFWEEFNKKGRRSDLLLTIPKYLITHQCVAFLGLSHFFDKKV